jgi:4,5-dihydroxyphthalate decarboxylase
MSLVEENLRSNGGSKTVPISMAFADYDRTRPLLEGKVVPQGIALNACNKWVGDFCHRPVYEEYDAAEMSLSWYVAARERQEPCIAIPIFPLRDPILAYIYTRADSGITHPSQLIGKRIGTFGYRYTINCWIRGLLEDHYGLSPNQVTWITSEAEGAGYEVPSSISLQHPDDKLPSDRLRDGEVDAILAPRVPTEFKNREPWIRRLFPDCKQEGHKLVNKLGFIPVSHVIVLNEKLATREPWIAKSLYDAFVRSQQMIDDVWRTEKVSSFVDSMFYLEEQQDVYGNNPFEHGLTEANRANIALFVKYAVAQGYIKRELSMDDLFLNV